MKRSSGGNSSKQQQQMIAQIIQAYAQLTQDDPRRIMQQLKGLPPEQQQKSIEGMYKAIQLTQQQGQGQQAQPQQAQPQQMMAAPQAQQQMSPQQAQMMQQQQMAGGMDQSQMGDQSQMAMYGGGYKHGGSTYSNGVWFEDGGYIPEYNYAYGGYHSEIPRLFNQEVDRPNKAMYGMGMANGGIVVGQVMDANPELLQRLEQGGYTYKIIG
jgi:hypothetical protein